MRSRMFSPGWEGEIKLKTHKKKKELFLRQPRVERGSTAEHPCTGKVWKAAMITVTPLALLMEIKLISDTYEENNYS